METILKTAIIGAIVFAALFSAGSFAAEFKRIGFSKCKTVGGFHGCTEVPPEIMFTDEEFESLKNAKSPSNDDLVRFHKGT